ncbi:hypothetical protein H0Z60_07685 [Ectothiorhodospiraceae bacterium WFHF3C12]|nr:hypothetical protein [Ectothiorhodospiraceae bacterium WFHF3C12]
MLRMIVIAAGLLLSAGAGAQQAARAVSQANFNLSAGHAEADDLTLDELAVEANLPLGAYFGLGAGIRRQWVEVSADSGAGTDADVLGGEVGLFARDPGRGVLGLEYGRSERSPETGEDLEAETYRGVFALYDQAFDLILSRADTEYDDDRPTLHTANAELASYGGPNIRIAAAYGFLDVADDLDVTLAYQPDFTGNVLAFELGYADTEADGEVYSGRVVYYFGAPRSLISRYREQLLP